jgi:DNA-binding transcriptional MerR regulator
MTHDVGRDDPPPFSIEVLNAFEGDAEALAVEATHLLALLKVVDDSAPLTARLVRDYAQRGIVRRPNRHGKETRYGSQHLVELLAARLLVRDGWPLAKIAQHIARTPHAELLGLISPAFEPPAVKAVRAIKARGAEPALKLQPSAPAAKPDPLDAARTTQAWLAQRKVELPGLLVSIGGTPHPDITTTVEIALAPDVRLTISTERLSRLTTADADAIGRAVIASLLAAAPKGTKS